MIRLRALALALVVIGLPMGGAQARVIKAQVTPAPVSKARPSASAYDKCLASPAGQTMAGMNDCVRVELQAQDARLSRAYQAAILRLERPRQKTALQKAQRAWIAFRDADCASYMDDDWGSISGLQASQCALDRTRERAGELEAYRK